MMSVESLFLSRGGRPVLSHLNFSLVSGEVLAVLGPNGAGKSSLLAALSGEIKPDAGHIRLLGHALAAWSDLDRAKQLAVLPQSPTLGFGFNVTEVVSMGRLPHATGIRVDMEMIKQAMQAADVMHLAQRNYLSLSGGERQRVHLARVLAQLGEGETGQVLLLDEPTAMLDPTHQHACLQATRELARRGVAVLVILHDLNLAARYADRIMLLKQGQCQSLGFVEEVLTEAQLADVFDLPVLITKHPLRGHPVVMAR
ncbi:MAG: heme ABC transporter ATP-binding protein [Moraxellaceae bacterium]|nr:heme ABC transporter ATP-binding protein [Moraxellaceae bacterium]MDZ4298174.1 heme ABC transporter ATP-binding protein [Moraxellaceae bacterium]MDZ4386989.1 heme ABC transporter ATP-binding protein [Moraxellaceae bacterium]